MVNYEPIKLYIWLMNYNWQQKDWPNFQYEEDKIGVTPLGFGLASGQMEGILIGLPDEKKNEAIIDLLVSEAIKTSEIEGEFLSRQDVRSSVIKTLGLEQEPKQVRDQRAKGIAKLMVTIRKNYKQPLSEAVLFQWHKLVMSGNKKLVAGQWRSHSSPMQIVSGAVGKEKVHFEAPPSASVPKEMQGFINWFNETAPGQPKAMSNAMVRSALAHLYFESIHPFEDGNGRIGRAISEKALSQGLGQPIILSLSSAIEKKREAYYKALKNAQRSNEVTKWVVYFAITVVEAQKEAKKVIDFSLLKAKFFDVHTGMNKRQTKVINRMFQEGPNGYEGGMNAKKYMSITKTSKATATRDLQALSDAGIFNLIGAGRSVRYELKW